MLEKVKRDLYSCGRCGLCVIRQNGMVCPAYKYGGQFDSLAARGRNSGIRAVLEGQIELGQDVVDVNYTCMGCKLCQVACNKRDHAGNLLIDEARITQELRKEIFKCGMTPEPLKAGDALVDKTGNPFGLSPFNRTNWAEGLNLPKKADVVYFAGCYAALRKTNIAKATVAIFREAGIDIGYLGEEEVCCGVPELNDGNEALAEKLMQQNIDAIAASGAKTVVTSCAGCFHALKTEYAEIYGELPFEVKHTSECIAELIEAGKITLAKGVNKKVTYHDPCHLGRHEGVYDAPRAVINAIPGIEFNEMGRNKEWAWCCGGGSVVSNVYPELTKAVSGDRVEEAKEAGAQLIISACPSCEENLGGAGRKQKVRVEDLNVIVAQSMELKF